MTDPARILPVYLAAANLFAFCLCIHDKMRAKKGGRRVPERRLFAAAIMGGAFGMFAGMLLVRHKTRRWYFMVFMPLLCLLWGYLLLRFF